MKSSAGKIQVSGFSDLFGTGGVAPGLVRGVPKLLARKQVAQDAGEKSGVTVTRYISLTKLIPPLLAMVDEEKLAVSTAADYIADLPHDEQIDLLTVIEKLDVIPVKNQLVRIKKYSKQRRHVDHRRY